MIVGEGGAGGGGGSVGAGEIGEGGGVEDVGAHWDRAEAAEQDPSGSSPHSDIQGYPRISQDIQRYPKIYTHQHMFWICKEYIFGISMDIIWTFLDKF